MIEPRAIFEVSFTYPRVKDLKVGDVCSVIVIAASSFAAYKCTCTFHKHFTDLSGIAVTHIGDSREEADESNDYNTIILGTTVKA